MAIEKETRGLRVTGSSLELFCTPIAQRLIQPAADCFHILPDSRPSARWLTLSVMESPRKSTLNHSVSASAKSIYGFVIPLLLFFLLQIVLLTLTSGTGGFEGMGVVLIGVVATPALLVLNGWTVLIRWREKRSLLYGGLFLPCMIGLVESLWTIGPAPIQHLINKTIVAPFLWIWLFIVLLFLPLITSAIYTYRRQPI